MTTSTTSTSVTSSAGPSEGQQPDRHPLFDPNLLCVNGEAQGCAPGGYTAVVITRQPALKPGHVRLGLRLLDTQGQPMRYFVGLQESDESDLNVGDKLDVMLLREGRGLYVDSQYFTEKFRQVMMAI